MATKCRSGPLRGRPRTGRRRIAATLCALALPAVLAGCGAPGAAQDPSTIKIGFLAEQSGSYEEFGRAAKVAADLAIEKINAGGGITVQGRKRPVELVVYNTRSEPTEGAALTMKLLAKDEVHFVFGATGLIAPAVFPLTDATRTLFFSASSAATARIADTRYMIGTLPDTATRVDITLSAIQKNWPATKSIAFLGTDEPTANSVRQVLAAAAEKHGLRVVATESVPGGTTDFTGTLTRIKSGRPDVLLHVADDANSQAIVIRQNKQVGATPNVMAYAVGCETAQRAGVTDNYAANPLVGADLSAPRNPEARELADRLRAELGGDMTSSYAAMWQYDFFGVLAQAIARAGTAEDTDAVRDALRQTDYDGASGRITMAGNRTAVFGFDVCTLSGGKITTDHVSPRSTQ